ncbi:MAG: hypothetical protein LRY55_14035 [Leadbetterella sp.]|nr:hypothetical protein [Leadbetterella sp.]
MKTFLRNWNLSRILRLAIGIAVVVQGILVTDWMLISLGALFSLMPLMNIGCSATGTCSPRYPSKDSNDFTYKEIK